MASFAFLAPAVLGKSLMPLCKSGDKISSLPVLRSNRFIAIVTNPDSEALIATNMALEDENLPVPVNNLD